jgi:hypothetical protein
MKYILRRTLINATHRLESLAKQLRGAADKVLPEKRLFLGDCEAQNWENIRPCFVLSTGRCGTLLLNNILTLSPDANALHVPQPEMHRPSRRAYEQVTQQPEIFREVFKSAREEYLLAAARQDKVYIETNNQVTFFAPIICDVFPRTVFIHLVRHPGSFVRSGIRRKWYTGNNPYDVGRIVPQEDELKKSGTSGVSSIRLAGYGTKPTALLRVLSKPSRRRAFCLSRQKISLRTRALRNEFLSLPKSGDLTKKSLPK